MGVWSGSSGSASCAGFKKKLFVTKNRKHCKTLLCSSHISFVKSFFSKQVSGGGILSFPGPKRTRLAGSRDLLALDSPSTAGVRSACRNEQFSLLHPFRDRKYLHGFRFFCGCFCSGSTHVANKDEEVEPVEATELEAEGAEATETEELAERDVEGVELTVGAAELEVADTRGVIEVTDTTEVLEVADTAGAINIELTDPARAAEVEGAAGVAEVTDTVRAAEVTDPAGIADTAGIAGVVADRVAKDVGARRVESLIVGVAVEGERREARGSGPVKASFKPGAHESPTDKELSCGSVAKVS